MVEGSLKGGLARRFPKSKWYNQMTEKLLNNQEASEAVGIQSSTCSKDQRHIQNLPSIN